MNRSFAAMLPLLSVLMAGACGHGGLPAGFIAPTVSLSGVTVRGFGFTGGSLDVNLLVNNPNSVDIRGTHLELGLDLEGVHFGPATLDQAFNVPATGGAPVTVPVTFRWSDVGSAAKTILGYGSARYTLNGKIGVQLPGAALLVPFTQQGTVTLSQLGGVLSNP